ncbi:MAG: hypothetical protein M1829_001844 [Trizodia sp. TS-e1964]|nr:MAG: hypothetical protein M1829_001844 [Trizodia sp. TS-e1964]
MSNPSDEGQIWFSDSDAEEKILEFLTDSTNNISLQNSSFLDLGSGNGHLLIHLRKAGCFEGPMVGVDYSEKSVKLAKRITRLHRIQPAIQFELWDILGGDGIKTWAIEGGFDVVLDKGTFDAISMSKELDITGRRVCEGYRERVEQLVKRGGLVLLTSCNWTEFELCTWMEGGELEYHATIDYPTFVFGGSKGQTISSVCFRRK